MTPLPLWQRLKPDGICHSVRNVFCRAQMPWALHKTLATGLQTPSRFDVLVPTLCVTAIKLRKSASFRQGSPEPRLHGWYRLSASLQSGFRRSMPE